MVLEMQMRVRRLVVQDAPSLRSRMHPLQHRATGVDFHQWQLVSLRIIQFLVIFQEYGAIPAQSIS